MRFADQLIALGQKVPGGKIIAIHLDDESEVLEAHAQLWASYGFDVRATTSIEDALEILRREGASVGLIISDFNMNGYDGFDFRTRVLETKVRAPFVIYSGCLTKEMALRAIELKISGFVEKPVVEADFLQLLEREVLPYATNLSEEAELMQGFLADAGGLIEEIERSAQDLERDPANRDTLNTLFGTAHTLKGASGFFEPRDLHHFVHRFEDHLKRLQTAAEPPTSHDISAILHAVDVMSDLLTAFTDPARIFDVEALKTDLDAIFTATTATAGPSTATSAQTGGDAHHHRETKDTFVKVETTVIDEFLKTSGELTIIRNMLKKSVEALGRQRGGDEEIQQLHDLLEEMHKANSSMQKRVHEIRKVSLANVLKPLPRVVRDVSQTLGKKVRLETTHAVGRIDLAVADVIGKCIIHLVKNSMDHGLEPGDVRLAAGKPEAGVIELAAVVTDEVVTLTIRDDGAGLNGERIRRKLLEKGFDPAAVGAMSEREIHQMIFSPGFSTAAQTTELSGRGVGMSMVEETVKSIGGSIRVDSTSGQGSVFTLLLPAPKSVMIKSCLFVRVGRERYGLDQEQVHQVIESRGSRTYRRQDSAGVPLLQSSEGLLPLLDARDLLKMPKDEASQVIILQSENHGRFGLVVDEVLDFADAVIKAVPAFLNKGGLYVGATFLEDRRVGLLMRSDGLAELASLPNRPNVPPLPAPTVLTESVPTWIAFEDLAGRRRAILQTTVTRIELLKPHDVTQSGAMTLMRYRERVLALIENEDRQTPRDLDQVLPILVIENEHVTYGLVVREILEVVSAKPGDGWAETLVTSVGVLDIFRPDAVPAPGRLRLAV